VCWREKERRGGTERDIERQRGMCGGGGGEGRERGKEREGERQRGGKTEREKDREGERQRGRKTEKERERESSGEAAESAQRGCPYAEQGGFGGPGTSEAQRMWETMER